MWGDRGQGLPVESLLWHMLTDSLPIPLTLFQSVSVPPSHPRSIRLFHILDSSHLLLSSFCLLNTFFLWLPTSPSIHLSLVLLSLSLSISQCGELEASGRGMRRREMRVIKRGMKDWTGEGWVWRHAIWRPRGRPLVTMSCLSNTPALLNYCWVHTENTHTHTHTLSATSRSCRGINLRLTASTTKAKSGASYCVHTRIHLQSDRVEQDRTTHTTYTRADVNAVLCFINKKFLYSSYQSRRKTDDIRLSQASYHHACQH